MKKILLTAALLALTGLQPTLAHEGAKITTRDDALTVMREGVSFMGETVNKHKADLFADGKVMDQLHDVTVHIEEAADFLENESANMDSEKKKPLIQRNQTTRKNHHGFPRSNP